MQAEKQSPRRPRPRILALALTAAWAAPAAWADSTQAPVVQVIGTSPLPGFGRPAGEIPANVQSVGREALRDRQSLNLPDFMASQLPAVNVNETQGNPFQPDLNYRGFSASPLLGTPQGLSVFVDGVRANSPFGDTVNWDLIPQRALDSLTVIPGSNSLFGLNTLGGALAITTKDGFRHAGGEAEMQAGAWGRRTLEMEQGGHGGEWGYYLAGSFFEEDGWRERSPSEVKQLFAKLSRRTAGTDLDLSLTHGDTDLTGNGLVPTSMYQQRREQIFTHPDNTRNRLTQITLNGSHWLSDDTRLAGNVYVRDSLTRTLNGDANDEFEGSPNDADCDPADPAFDADDVAQCNLSRASGGTNEDTGANNRTRTRQRSHGFALQWSKLGERNQFAAGLSYDYSRSRFEQTEQEGVLNASRGVDSNEAITLANKLDGRTRTVSVFAADTWNLTQALALTASARYNRTHVLNHDLNIDPLNPAANLNGDFTYHKLNPALGLTWQASPALNLYAGFNQGNRAPSPIELGCADPANPCSLPNAMAADPYLKQVVVRTGEIGARGGLAGGVKWSAAAYRSQSQDDILFVGTSTSAGYFTNFGQTRRDGLELALAGSAGRLDWQVAYGWLKATFRSTACLLAENNSTRGQAPECSTTLPGSPDDLIQVRKGDRLPGIPEHSLKIGLKYRATEALRLGADLVAYSSQYLRGNENNQHQAGTFNGRTFEHSGKIGAYEVVNINADYQLARNWTLLGRVNNVFDRKYATGGALAENPFDASGAFQTDSDDWTRQAFLAPGAPRAAWVGVRYRWQ